MHHLIYLSCKTKNTVQAAKIMVHLNLNSMPHFVIFIIQHNIHENTFWKHRENDLLFMHETTVDVVTFRITTYLSIFLAYIQ